MMYYSAHDVDGAGAHDLDGASDHYLDVGGDHDPTGSAFWPGEGNQ